MIDYRTYRVGDVDLIPIFDGPLPTNLDRLLPEYRMRAEKLLTEAPADALTMNVYSFLLRLGDSYALIDAGAGSLMGKDLGRLHQTLDHLSIRPDQIEHIFMTHFHRDHYGGLVGRDGSAYFPKARLYMHEREAAYWLEGVVADMPPVAQRHIDQQRGIAALYEGRITRVRDGQKVLGLTVCPSHGHSPGHTCWLLESRGERVLAWGDLIHIAYLHLPGPDIAFEYDLDSRAARDSRTRILEWVSDEAITVAGAHLPGIGIAEIFRRNDGFYFRSI